MRIAPAIAAAALLASCAQGGKRPDFPSDWEQQHARELGQAQFDATPAPPAYPRKADLMPFFVSSASDFKYCVDRRSVSVQGGLVRYTLVSRSPGGVDNVSYEALDCRERQFRSFARGTDSGGWIERATPWQPIDQHVNRAQYALHWEYFCPNRIAIYTPAEGISALERGGHPWSKAPPNAGGGGGQ